MAKGKIIVMRLFGGLGNQLFQYAFLFALSRQGGKARLETSSYEHDDKRVCELHHFRVSLPIEGGPPPWAFRKSRIPACLRSLFAAPKYPHFREEKRHGFDPGLAAPPRRHTYFKGYFQTEQYFLHCREQLCREFRLKTPLTPENARILEDIRSCCSISLHIRRTDYLSNPYLSPPPLEYYLRSMAEMEGRLRAAGTPQESLRYFIFSDDIEWARQNLRPALPHVHVDINDGGTGYFDLELMRNCRHHIIANSTFSWWAAWLNEHAEKIVIAPRIWFNREEGDRYHTDDALIPGSWLRNNPVSYTADHASPLISVIVPIYNMESLLPRCLDSLAAQTLRNLEIICVDDGSTDGSGGIVRKYASGDSRFRLITQENSGRAEARNAGIRAAAAPYLGFADPDDYVEPDMYERLYRLAEESGADMVQCSYSPFLPAESGESRGMAEKKLLHIENTACDGVFTEKGEIFRLFLEDRITGVVWSKLFRRLLPGCSAPLEVRLPSSFTSGEDTLYVSRAIARCRSVALTSEKLYHYGLGGPQSVSSRNRKAETRPASYYAVFEMLTREKLREGVLGSNRTAYMNYIVPLLFPDNEMPAGRLRHWAELWREADITSEHVCGMPREQRAYLEAALAGRWIYLRLLQCFWKFKTARRKMFRLRFSKNGIDTLQILGYTLYSAKKLPRSSL